jgi:hypothetical protein
MLPPSSQAHAIWCPDLGSFFHHSVCVEEVSLLRLDAGDKRTACVSMLSEWRAGSLTHGTKRGGRVVARFTAERKGKSEEIVFPSRHGPRAAKGCEPLCRWWLVGGARLMNRLHYRSYPSAFWTLIGWKKRRLFWCRKRTSFNTVLMKSLVLLLRDRVPMSCPSIIGGTNRLLRQLSRPTNAMPSQLV